MTIVVVLLASRPAYAYLDPGTGSILVQGLLAALAGVSALVATFWSRIRRFFSGRQSPGPPADRSDADTSRS